MITSVLRPAMVVLAAAPLLAACSSNVSRFSQPEPPPPVLSAPTPQVSARQLPPLGGAVSGNQGFGEQADGRQDQQMAALPPQTEPPTQESVLGQWSLSSPGDSCRISIALTSWEGGYRASTQGCMSPELTNVGAWNIEGNLVVLKDNEGNPVARLQRSGSTRFDGRLELGGALTMSR